MHSTIEDWIRKDAVSFSLDSSAETDATIDKVVASLGEQVQLLGLGEAVHGAEDILILRNHMFQRLVTKHGYSAFALESTFPKAHVVDDYINGRGPATFDEIISTGFATEFGRLEANRELVEWMRQYNADPSHKVKLHFYGIDVPTNEKGVTGPATLLQVALDYLASIDKAGADKYHGRIDPLLSTLDGWENPAAWADTTKAIGQTPAAAALRLATEDLIMELRTRRPELVAKSDPQAYQDAIHHAQLARLTLNFHAAMARESGEPPLGPRGVRDALMADNLAYFVAREKGRGKVFVFAHNGHLQRGKALWPCCGQSWGTETFRWWPAGSQLKQMLGNAYAVIGTGIGESIDNGITRADPATLEGKLAAAPGHALFIPTYDGHAVPAGQIEALPMRTASMKNLTYTIFEPQSMTDFNWLLLFDKVAYNRGGTPLQDWGDQDWGDATKKK